MKRIIKQEKMIFFHKEEASFQKDQQLTEGGLSYVHFTFSLAFSHAIEETISN